jgi:hypothetical protein
MTEDLNEFERRIRQSCDDLLVHVRAGEITEEEANKELDVVCVLCELILMGCDLGPRPDAPEGKMKRDGALLSFWPDACRRAGVPVMEIPDDIMQRLVQVTGRPS